MSNLLFKPGTVNHKHPLARMLRLIFTRLHITEDRFFDLHRAHMSRLSIPQQKVQSDRSNIKRTIRSDITLSWGKFYHAILDVLNLDLLDFSLTLRSNQTGEIFHVSLRDKVDEEGNYIKAPPPPEETLR